KKNSRNRRLVVRAVDLAGQYQGSNENGNRSSIGPHFSSSQELLKMADFVVFQSNFQREAFLRSGFRPTGETVIHNGATDLFLRAAPHATSLKPGDDLILVSSSMSTGAAKRHDLIAKFSLLPNVRVTHCGVWPSNVDSANVELEGVQDH